MADTTNNREYNVPQQGEANWHEPVNENWRSLDSEIQRLYRRIEKIRTEQESDTTSGSGGDGAGFGWDQTFTDTTWLTDADASGTLNVEKVTTLDYGASGGIQEAANASGPTVVVFEVGGVIDMDGATLDPAPQTWIAGETAPDPGISLIAGRLRPRSDDFIASHIGVYRGDRISEGDTVAPDGDDQIFDHCTVMWGTDENVGMSNEQHRVSVINTIIAECLYDSVHGESLHSRGYLVNDENSSQLCTMGCLFAHNNRRHPLTRGDHVLVNNYLYNYAGGDQNSGNIVNFNSPGEPDITAKGILLEPGAYSDTDREVFSYSGTLYADDILRPDGQPVTDGSQNMVDTPPILPAGLDLGADAVSAADLPGWIAGNCGMRPVSRPAVDAALISNRLQNAQGLVDSQDEVGGYPDYAGTTRALEVPSSDVVSWVRGYTNDVEVSG